MRNEDPAHLPRLVGKLLVATPALRDPNFERAVVLVVSHDDDGALGVVLNRATEMATSDVLHGWDQLVGDPSVVFEGGPVQPESAICLARVRPGVDVDGFKPLNRRLGTLDITRAPEGFTDQIEGMRVFAGYSGWSAMQLRAEIADGAWFVFDSLPGDAFAPVPDDLWSVVLRRQGGLIAAVSLFPSDPILN